MFSCSFNTWLVRLIALGNLKERLPGPEEVDGITKSEGICSGRAIHVRHVTVSVRRTPSVVCHLGQRLSLEVTKSIKVFFQARTHPAALRVCPRTMFQNMIRVPFSLDKLTNECKSFFLLRSYLKLRGHSLSFPSDSPANCFHHSEKY